MANNFLFHRGAWSRTNAEADASLTGNGGRYLSDNTVTHAGSYWRCVTDNTVDEPSSNAAGWEHVGTINQVASNAGVNSLNVDTSNDLTVPSDASDALDIRVYHIGRTRKSIGVYFEGQSNFEARVLEWYNYVTDQSRTTLPQTSSTQTPALRDGMTWYFGGITLPIPNDATIVSISHVEDSGVFAVIIDIPLESGNSFAAFNSVDTTRMTVHSDGRHPIAGDINLVATGRTTLTRDDQTITIDTPAIDRFADIAAEWPSSYSSPFNIAVGDLYSVSGAVFVATTANNVNSQALYTEITPTVTSAYWRDLVNSETVSAYPTEDEYEAGAGIELNQGSLWSTGTAANTNVWLFVGIPARIDSEADRLSNQPSDNNDDWIQVNGGGGTGGGTEGIPSFTTNTEGNYQLHLDIRDTFRLTTPPDGFVQGTSTISAASVPRTNGTQQTLAANNTIITDEDDLIDVLTTLFATGDDIGTAHISGSHGIDITALAGTYSFTVNTTGGTGIDLTEVDSDIGTITRTSDTWSLVLTAEDLRRASWSHVTTQADTRVSVDGQTDWTVTNFDTSAAGQGLNDIIITFTSNRSARIFYESLPGSVQGSREVSTTSAVGINFVASGGAVTTSSIPANTVVTYSAGNAVTIEFQTSSARNNFADQAPNSTPFTLRRSVASIEVLEIEEGSGIDIEIVDGVATISATGGGSGGGLLVDNHVDFTFSNISQISNSSGRQTQFTLAAGNGRTARQEAVALWEYLTGETYNNVLAEEPIALTTITSSVGNTLTPPSPTPTPELRIGDSGNTLTYFTTGTDQDATDANNAFADFIRADNSIREPGGIEEAVTNIRSGTGIEFEYDADNDTVTINTDTAESWNPGSDYQRGALVYRLNPPGIYAALRGITGSETGITEYGPVRSASIVEIDSNDYFRVRFTEDQTVPTTGNVVLRLNNHNQLNTYSFPATAIISSGLVDPDVTGVTADAADWYVLLSNMRQDGQGVFASNQSIGTVGTFFPPVSTLITTNETDNLPPEVDPANWRPLIDTTNFVRAPEGDGTYRLRVGTATVPNQILTAEFGNSQVTTLGVTTSGAQTTYSEAAGFFLSNEPADSTSAYNVYTDNDSDAWDDAQSFVISSGITNADAVENAVAGEDGDYLVIYQDADNFALFELGPEQRTGVMGAGRSHIIREVRATDVQAGAPPSSSAMANIVLGRRGVIFDTRNVGHRNWFEPVPDNDVPDGVFTPTIWQGVATNTPQQGIVLETSFANAATTATAQFRFTEAITDDEGIITYTDNNRTININNQSNTAMVFEFNVSANVDYNGGNGRLGYTVSLGEDTPDSTGFQEIHTSSTYMRNAGASYDGKSSVSFIRAVSVPANTAHSYQIYQWESGSNSTNSQINELANGRSVLIKRIR